MLQQDTTIVNKLGLHARASAKLTQLAGNFQSEVWMTRNGRKINAKSIMGVMMLAAGIGGSFSTISSFPDWAQHAARLSPAYWAITAIHEVSLDGANLSDVGMRIGVLWGFFAVIAGLALIQFRYHRE